MLLVVWWPPHACHQGLQSWPQWLFQNVRPAMEEMVILERSSCHGRNVSAAARHLPRAEGEAELCDSSSMARQCGLARNNNTGDVSH